MSWEQKLWQHLIEKFGDSHGTKIAKKYSGNFSASYCEQNRVEDAADDILEIEKLLDENIPLQIKCCEVPNGENKICIKFYINDVSIPLFKIMPILKNAGFLAYREQTWQLRFEDNKTVWLSYFYGIFSQKKPIAIKNIAPLFEASLIRICLSACENDIFNRLILISNLSWREVTIIRAYAKYMSQSVSRFSHEYIENILEKYADITKKLIEYFSLKFNPVTPSTVEKSLSTLEEVIQKQIEEISGIDDDYIVNYFFSIIKATLRTNYFKTDNNNNPKEYLSFKLDSAAIKDLPLPRPKYEIFVYSSFFEGIHLRNSKVARGGIRASDRLEDYRTEVLGLMKTQNVKNSIIVPSGAKGGFVLKNLPPNMQREWMQNKIIECYKLFISGLLDLTDNIENKVILSPKNVVCYDENDPYFVVAADKGTAKFSNLANTIAKEYNFWLSDAFASGGSTGYDHKKMGITARGVWESIKRHFRDLEINIETQSITTVGIGDMGGDVFGNGILYSKQISLIAAFDNRHIFIDPTPDLLLSYAERLRLFNLANSSWADYDNDIISAGGGVYSRFSKKISITSEMKKALAIEDDELKPDDLIRAILKAPVDLLYNGGIGTYVKSSDEANTDVGDKINELCRINANELRCKVVGEGGNLGFTQLARVEFALQGGCINADFIDNSAGVDCSDHEVNIKLLLNNAIDEGQLTCKERDELLVKMTNDVAQQVLKNNYNQALVISFSSRGTKKYIGLFEAYIKYLETTVHLNRKLEFLPETRKLAMRKSSGNGITKPELSVLVAYTKIHIKNELIKSDLLKDPFFIKVLQMYFPAILNKPFSKSMGEHELHREIISIQLSNQFVAALGITCAYRLQTVTGASISKIIRCYIIASVIYKTEESQQLIDSLHNKISISKQYEFLHYIRNLLNLAMLWFLRGNRAEGCLQDVIDKYTKPIEQLELFVPELMLGMTKDYLEKTVSQFVEVGLDERSARKIAVVRAMYTSLNIIEVSIENKFDLHQTAEVYFAVGGKCHLVWFRDQIAKDDREGEWNNMARITLRNDLDKLQRNLTIAVLKDKPKKRQTNELLSSWFDKNKAMMHRWENLLTTLYVDVDYTKFFTAIRELSNMVSELGRVQASTP